MSGSSKSSFFRIKSPTEIKIVSSVFYSSKGKFIIGRSDYRSPMFFRLYFKFQVHCDCPQMLPARKASLSLPQLLFSFLIKMFQMGDSCSHSIFSYSFWQMQPKPYLYLLLFMLELCNFELAIKADFIFQQNVLEIHPN